MLNLERFISCIHIYMPYKNNALATFTNNSI